MIGLKFICSLEKGDFNNGENLKYLDVKTLRGEKEAKIIKSGCIVNPNEKVIIVDGENSGEIFTVSERGYMGSTMRLFVANKFINQEYLDIFLQTLKNTLRKNKKGSAIPHLNPGLFYSFMVPLPPIEEQERIAYKVNIILKKIEEIKVINENITKLKDIIRTRIIQLGVNGKLLKSDDNYYYQNLPHTFEPLHTQIKVLDQYRRPINSNERKVRIAKATIKYPYYGATGQAGEIDEYLLDGQYVLIGEDCAPFLDKHQDKVYIVNGKFWVNNHAHILSSKCNEFLCFYLNAFDYHQYVSGTTRLKLTQKDLKRIPYPVLSEHFQKQIAQSIIKAIKPLDLIT